MKFRYEAILRVKKYKEDILKEEVATLTRTIDFEEGVLAHIEELIDNSFDEISRLQRGEFLLDEIKKWRNYIIELSEKRKQQKERVDEFKKELDKTMEKLINASIERRTMERLKERAQIMERKKQEVVEQDVLDEIGLSQFLRNANILSFKK
ncbi:TPA: flagellar export protein FliJ [bacterium]|nr:flagellar export protein FliJ [bacterium]